MANHVSTFKEVPDNSIICRGRSFSFRKVGDSIVDENDKVVGWVVERTFYGFVHDKYIGRVLSDTLFKLDLFTMNYYTAPEDMEPVALLGTRAGLPIFETNYGILANHFLIDLRYKKFVLSPFLEKMYFPLFPLFLSGGSYSISDEEKKILRNNRDIDTAISEFLDAAKSGYKIILFDKRAGRYYSELVWTKIEPKMIIKPRKTFQFGPAPLLYLIKDQEN